MKKTIKQSELYSAPAIKVLAFEARKTIMQMSPNGDNPGATVHPMEDGGEI